MKVKEVDSSEPRVRIFKITDPPRSFTAYLPSHNNLPTLTSRWTEPITGKKLKVSYVSSFVESPDVWRIEVHYEEE